MTCGAARVGMPMRLATNLTNLTNDTNKQPLLPLVPAKAGIQVRGHDLSQEFGMRLMNLGPGLRRDER
uniref:hypothetical protein n=1 Tax=Phenylobacterium sp. TaxID=1871053 RepID=UPI00286D7A05